jgi:hypothetical protein
VFPTPRAQINKEFFASPGGAPFFLKKKFLLSFYDFLFGVTHA